VVYHTEDPLALLPLLTVARPGAAAAAGLGLRIVLSRSPSALIPIDDGVHLLPPRWRTHYLWGSVSSSEFSVRQINAGSRPPSPKKIGEGGVETAHEILQTGC